MHSDLEISKPDIAHSVKAVIWDLDETFWTGTLSEGGITPVPAHVAMIRHLVDRGIMCSIVSKNHLDTARAELEKLGVWDLFIFPYIDWTSKGQAIKNQIDAMQLRAENVLFIDDNETNLAEAQFACPGIMTLSPIGTDLTALLDLPQLQGKDDSSHSRLQQYKMMESKQLDFGRADVSNDEFLRQSGIRLQFIWDLDANRDRMLELINRTNQLNFTKLRVETPEDLAKFDESLANPRTHAGLIRVVDNYGDYGIVGFFLLIRSSGGSRLQHFAFSCRTLNMGIEQWVYERIGKPPLIYKGETANGLDEPSSVDWITEVKDLELQPDTSRDRHLCLVGGCDLMQMSFYCGNRRDEFVNITRNDMLVRFDEFGTYLNPRDDRTLDVFASRVEMPKRSELSALDKSLSTCDIAIISLYHGVASDQYYTFGDDRQFMNMFPNSTLRQVLSSNFGIWFTKNFFYKDLSIAEKAGFTRASIERIVSLMRPDAPLVLMSASEQGEKAQTHMDARKAYNEALRDMARQNPQITVLEVDEILQPEDFFDPDHYVRSGYYKLARFVNHIAPIDKPSAQAAADTPRAIQTPPRAAAPRQVQSETETQHETSSTSLPAPNMSPSKHMHKKASPPMTRMLEQLYLTDPYVDAPLDDVEVDMQGWGSTHFLFQAILELQRPTRIVEVGSWKGLSAIHMATVCKDLGIEDFEICCIDTWLGSPGLWNTAEMAQKMLKLKNGYPMLYFTFMKNVIESGHQDVITPLPMPSDMGHFVLKKRRFEPEFAYIDAAHDYENVKRDLERYWAILAPNGVLLGDDYDEKHVGVVQAAHDFADENGLEIATTQGKFAFAKTPELLDGIKAAITVVDQRRAKVAARHAEIAASKAKAELENKSN